MAEPAQEEVVQEELEADEVPAKKAKHTELRNQRIELTTDLPHIIWIKTPPEFESDQVSELLRLNLSSGAVRSVEPCLKVPPLRYEKGNFNDVHMVCVGSAAQLEDVANFFDPSDRDEGKRLHGQPLIDPMWGWKLVEEQQDEDYKVLFSNVPWHIQGAALVAAFEEVLVATLFMTDKTHKTRRYACTIKNADKDTEPARLKDVEAFCRVPHLLEGKWAKTTIFTDNKFKWKVRWVASLPGYPDGYLTHHLTEALRRAVPLITNTIAIVDPAAMTVQVRKATRIAPHHVYEVQATHQIMEEAFKVLVLQADWTWNGHTIMYWPTGDDFKRDNAHNRRYGDSYNHRRPQANQLMFVDKNQPPTE